MFSSADEMDKYTSGGERLFTHNDIIDEIIELKKEHLTDEHHAFLETVAPGTEIEFRKAAFQHNRKKKWACDILSRIRSEKPEIEPSAALKLSVANIVQNIAVNADGTIQRDGHAFDPFDSYFVQNDIEQLQSDVSFDFDQVVVVVPPTLSLASTNTTPTPTPTPTPSNGSSSWGDLTF